MPSKNNKFLGFVKLVIAFILAIIGSLNVMQIIDFMFYKMGNIGY